MLRIRSLTREDVPQLRQMILELATYERLAHEVTVTEETLARDGFHAVPRYRALFAEWNGEAAGYAVFFPVYSTFQGTSLFLADIFVRDRFRGKGIGKGLMAEVAAFALREGIHALRWEVLGWNRSAIDFYKSLGAIFLSEWKEVLLEGRFLKQLAESSPR